MRVLVLTIISALALPFMVFGQADEQKQTKEKETETTAPATGKEKTHSAQEQTTTRTNPETNTGGREQTNVQPSGRTEETKKTEAGTRSTTNETNVKSGTQTQTKVNVQEFRQRHSEVFSLGQHPKEFFVQRFGENHFRLIGNTYFVFVDSCWVSVHVDGFGYTERVICPGDADYIEVY